MSADSTVTVPTQRRRITALDPAANGRFVGRVPTDPVAALARRMQRACIDAVDVDEVAAILEANGINDRVAEREYGVPSVFALASRVVARGIADCPTVVALPPVVEVPTVGQVARDTLLRAAIYLTPLAIGLGAASQVDGVPPLAVTGTLMVGWGGGQALSYLGYRAQSEHGDRAAARLLGNGFLLLTSAWLAVLALVGVHAARGFAVAGVQLSLFAVAAVALVTNREKSIVGWAAPCWLSTVGIFAGLGGAAVAALLVSVAVLVGVAFHPVLRRGPTGLRLRAWRRDFGVALVYGAVGTGQAALLTVVAIPGVSVTRLPPEALPLLVGVPLIELTLVWHHRRIAAARAALYDRFSFDRRLARVSAGTAVILATPVVVGALLAVATWMGVPVPGGQALAAAILLTAIYALCLVLAAHRRAGTAAILVWWPALLVAGVTMWASALTRVSPHFTETLATATLLGASLPGLLVAALVLRDPESYR